MYLAGNDSIYFKTHVIRKTLTSSYFRRRGVLDYFTFMDVNERVVSS